MIKTLWKLDKTYFALTIVFLIICVIDLFKLEMTAFSIDLVFVYMALNELRYKYDNINKN